MKIETKTPCEYATMSVGQLNTLSTEYGESFPLSGRELAMLDFRLKQMFRKGYIDICKLDSLYRKINTSEKNIPAARSDLEALHCEYFTEMPGEVRAMIPDLVGQYLGIRMYPANHERPVIIGPLAVRLQPGRVFALLLALVVLAALCAVAIMPARPHAMPTEALQMQQPQPKVR